MNRILFFKEECEGNTVEVFDHPSAMQSYRIHIFSDDVRTQHILCILKAQKGDMLDVGIIDEGYGSCTIQNIDATGIDLVCTLHGYIQRKHHKSTILLAHPRPPVSERLIRDLSCMAIDNIICYVPERGEKSYLNSSVWKKAQHLSLLGAMQGKICTVPTLYTCVGLEKALSIVKNILQVETETVCYLPIMIGQNASTAVSNILMDFAQQYTKYDGKMNEHTYGNKSNTFLQTLGISISEEQRSIQRSESTHLVYFIGPERHYTTAETLQLQKLSLYYSHLGIQVLRTEVASLLVQGLWNMCMKL